MKEKDMPSSSEFDFPSDEGGEPMDPDVELKILEELLREAREAENSAESDNVQNAESIQEQLSELQAEFRQRAEDHTVLEGQLLAKIKGSRGILYLALKSEGSGFEMLGGKYADTIDPDQVVNTFNWLKGRKVNDFFKQSAYLENVAARKEEKLA